jgi:hypothetical protein
LADGVNGGANGGVESCRLLTHSEPPSGSLVTGSIGRELRRGEDSVGDGSGAMGRGAQSGGTKVLRMRLHRSGATAIVRDTRAVADEIACVREKENAIRCSESRS